MAVGDTETTIASKSKGLIDESMRPFTTKSSSLAPKLNWIHNSKRVELTQPTNTSRRDVRGRPPQTS